MLDGIGIDEFIRWVDLNTPLTRKAMSELDRESYRGISLLYAGHIEPKMVPHILFFARKGMKITVSPCVPGIAHAESFAKLAAEGIAYI